jgi:hypothetical protein
MRVQDIIKEHMVKQKVKVKLSLCLINWAQSHEDMRGSGGGGVGPHILKVGTRWR